MDIIIKYRIIKWIVIILPTQLGNTIHWSDELISKPYFVINNNNKRNNVKNTYTRLPIMKSLPLWSSRSCLDFM